MRSSSIYIPSDRNEILLELVYNDKTVSTKDSSFLRIKNAYTGSINWLSFNPIDYSKPERLTGNILDRTVQQISDSNWVHFDIDRPIRYFEQRNSGLIFESLWHDIEQEIIVTYNTLRIHIISGYNFDDIAGLVYRAVYMDNKSNQVFVLNNAYLKEDSVNYHSTPFMLGDRVYDRYIEVSFPTLDNLTDINSQISPALSANDNLFYGGGQFPDVNNSKLILLMYEANHYETDAQGQLIIRTVLPMNSDSSGIFRRELDLQDSFADISANVQESFNGDYFELFPSYQGQFLQDFLYQRAQRNNETYLIIHDIDVFEQQYDAGGFSEVKTQNFTQIQDNSFDKPFKFRPIVESSETIAFTIEYTVRLFNQTDPSHIIRRASLTYRNAKKYGRKLQKLDVPVGFQPMRIVNKILKTTNNSLLSNNPYTLLNPSNNNSAQQIIKNIFIPIQQLDVSVNAKTAYMTNITSSDIVNLNNSKFKIDDIVNSTVIFGQGDGEVYLSRFDNFLKIKIYKEQKNKLIPYAELFETKDSVINFVFEDSNKEKIKIKNYYVDPNIIQVNLNPGEIIFKLDAATSIKALDSNNKKFWITIENKLNLDTTTEFRDFETVLYTGYIYELSNYESYDSPSYKSKFILLDSKINEYTNIKNEMDMIRTKMTDIIDNINSISLSTEEKKQMDAYIAQIKDLMVTAYGDEI